MSTMQVHTEHLGNGATLLLLPDDRFASIQIKLWYAASLQAERLTSAALLPMVLKRGNAMYPSQRELAMQLEALWGAELQSSVMNAAGRHLTSFEIDCTDPRFLPEDGKDLLRHAMCLIADLVQSPYMPSGVFSPDTVREEKNTLLNTLERQRNNRSSYAMTRLMELLYPGEAYGLSRLGSTDQLQLITPEVLGDYYRSFAREAQLTIGITGAFDIGEVRSMANEVFHHGAGDPLVLPKRPKNHSAEVNHIYEALPAAQSHLLMAFSSEIGYNDLLSLPMVFANSLLGAYAHSKLFRSLREDAGLAYSVWSSVDRFQGTIVAHAGLLEEKAPEAEDLVRAAVGEIQRGEISDDEWQMTQETLLDQYRQVIDDSDSLLEYHYLSMLLERPLSIEETMEAIRTMSRDEVCQAAKRLQLHTVYLLAGQEGDCEDADEEMEDA